MTRISGIHHVQFTVPPNRVDDARAFYCALLGLTEIPKPDSLRQRGGFWLQVGDRTVHVGVEEGHDPGTTKAHIAYQVPDLAVWRARLRAAGFSIQDGVSIPGYIRFEFRDPFGNRVEFIQPEQPHSDV